MHDEPHYLGPAEPDVINEEDAHEALEFLIAIEPDPDDDEIEGYDEHMAPVKDDIGRAMATLRAYAEQRQPRNLPDMMDDYHGFTNDDRYLETGEASGVVISALQDAWDGVGPWRK
jgi:hypothetical protein